MIGNRWNASVRQWVAIGIGALVLLALWILWPFLTPLALALLLTYILNPLVDRVEDQTGWNRTGAALFVYLGLLVVIALVPARLVPFLIDQGQRLFPPLLDAADDLGVQIAGIGTLIVFGQQIDPYALYEQAATPLLNMVTGVASSSVEIAFGVATTFLSTMLWLLFILVISFYIVRDTPNISRYIWGLIPRDERPEVYYLSRRVNRTWNAFLRGQLLLSSAIFVMTTLLLLILGVPQPIFLGLLAAVLNFVPNLGPVLASLPAIALALVQGSNNFEISNLLFGLVVVLAYVLIQQVESNVLVPRIIGGSVNLHPAVVIVGAIIGLGTIGLLGIFLAPPMLATIRVIAGYAYRKLLEPEYEPPDVVVPESIMALPGPRERPLPPITPPLKPGDSPVWRRLARRLTRWSEPTRRGGQRDA